MSLNIVNSFKLTPPPPGIVGGLVELARTTLGSPGNTITVSSIADKRYYMLLVDTLPSGNNRSTLTINNDTGNNYAHRDSSNGGADSTKVSRPSIEYGDGDVAETSFALSYWSNLSSKEKLGITHSVRPSTAGAGSAPTRKEDVAKWDNTSAAINRFDVINDQGGSFNTGSEVVVLGWDPADTHTDNFWEELASTTLGSPANDITVSFTSKKYMWFQLGTIPVTSGMNSNLRLGSSSTLDTGSNYAYRGSANGGADATATSSTSLDTFNGDQTVGNLSYCNGFFINNAANEKLIIYHSALIGTAGAGTAPARRENVGKWANTSNQADILGFVRIGGTGQHGIGSTLKVWGSN